MPILWKSQIHNVPKDIHSIVADLKSIESFSSIDSYLDFYLYSYVLADKICFPDNIISIFKEFCLYSNSFKNLTGVTSMIDFIERLKKAEEKNIQYPDVEYGKVNFIEDKKAHKLNVYVNGDILEGNHLLLMGDINIPDINESFFDSYRITFNQLIPRYNNVYKKNLYGLGKDGWTTDLGIPEDICLAISILQGSLEYFLNCSSIKDKKLYPFDEYEIHSKLEIIKSIRDNFKENYI